MHQQVTQIICLIGIGPVSIPPRLAVPHGARTETITVIIMSNCDLAVIPIFDGPLVSAFIRVFGEAAPPCLDNVTTFLEALVTVSATSHCFITDILWDGSVLGVH